jgi:hypothetical protein
MRKWILTTAVLFVLAGCTTETPKAEKKAKAPPQPISAQSAFFRMYGQARVWAQDAQILRLEPIRMDAMKEKDGKWPAWRAQFVSETKRSLKPFSYSVIEAEGVYEGVFGATEEPYSGPRGQNLPFLMQGFKIDSPAALETALKKGADYTKKHPDMPITMVLEKMKTDGNPTWRVIWGISVATSNHSIYVDATLGNYLRTMH